MGIFDRLRAHTDGTGGEAVADDPGTDGLAADGTRPDGTDGTGTTDGAAEQSPREKALLRELARLHNEAPGGAAPEPVRYALLFTGEVQFVGFRWTNQMLAEEHGLTGWVKNLDDGSVEMELQGPPATMAAHLGRLHASYASYGNRIWLETAERLDAVPDEEGFRVLNAWR